MHARCHLQQPPRPTSHLNPHLPPTSRFSTLVWPQRAAMQQHKGTVRVLAFSADGGTLASGGADKTVRLWATFNGTQRAELKGHTGAVIALSWNPDGEGVRGVSNISLYCTCTLCVWRRYVA